MILRNIKNKFLKKNTNEDGGNGLFVTVDELIAQRRYAYRWQTSQLNKFTSQNVGDVKSIFKGRGIEFEEIRAYEFGDDIRDIDWRVTARKQNPYTKIYAEEKDREVYVLLDLSPQMLFGTKKELKSVTAAKTAARIAWWSLKNKDRFGCVINDGKDIIMLKAQNTQINMTMIFKKIADVTKNILNAPQDNLLSGQLKKAIVMLEHIIKHKAIVFVISDFADFSDETKKMLALLGKKASVSCINVFDVLEKCPPVVGEYMVQQGNKKLVFSSSGSVFRKEYVSYFENKHNKIRDFCHKFNMKYIETNNDLMC